MILNYATMVHVFEPKYSDNNMTRMCTLIIVGIMWGVANSTDAAEVNIYSARKEALIKPLLDTFTEKTGIKVNLITGKADALLKRLVSEGRNSPADLFLTVDAGRLHRAKEAKVLQAITGPELAGTVPTAYRDPEGYWYGLSLRARVIAYATNRVKSTELSTYEDLADGRWKNRICIRSSENIYNQSLVASLIAANGAPATEQWAKGLVANMARKPQGGDRDQIKAVAAGQCDLTVINTYYYGNMLNAKDDPVTREAAEKTALFWPNQQGRGVHVNVSGAGVTAYAKNRDAAVKLLLYMLSPEAQQQYSMINYEYPIRENVSAGATLEAWGEFKTDSLNLETLGIHNRAAVMLMDRAGWR